MEEKDWVSSVFFHFIHSSIENVYNLSLKKQIMVKLQSFINFLNIYEVYEVNFYILMVIFDNQKFKKIRQSLRKFLGYQEIKH